MDKGLAHSKPEGGLSIPGELVAGKTALDVACPRCGADPSAPCRTRTGYDARTHSGRFIAAGLVEDYDTRGQVYDALRRAQAIARQERHKRPQWFDSASAHLVPEAAMKDERRELADRIVEAIKASSELAMPQVALSMADAESVLQALRSQPSVEEGWRDMSSAPRDGTDILVCCGPDEDPMWGVAWWNDGGWEMWWETGGKKHPWPEYWMPLLDPPPSARQIASMYGRGE